MAFFLTKFNSLRLSIPQVDIRYHIVVESQRRTDITSYINLEDTLFGQ